MAKGYVYIATSVDGFIARTDGRIDWLPTDSELQNESHGFETFIESIDAIVMGRETFETVCGFQPWPYKQPVFVLSQNLDLIDIPDSLRDKVSVVRSVQKALALADQNGWLRLYVDGGLTIQSFLKVGAIAELTITRIPILLGQGRPLFGAVTADVRLNHVATRIFPSGLVQSHYRIEN